jgi:two-component system, cell cycle sensor histidine kinase and response regulator CckA
MPRKKRETTIKKVHSPPNTQDKVQALRRKAEKALQARQDSKPEAPGSEKSRRMLHELQVHQIELEMQNEELRRVQAELETSQARSFDLYDLAPVGYCTLSEKGVILEANLTAASLLGVDRAALVKKPFTRFMLPGDKDISDLLCKRVFETGTQQVCELRLRKKDGASFWARLEARAALDKDGAPACRVVISNITEHKQDEKLLHESEEKYRTILETIEDGYFEVDLAGNITFSNGSLSRMLGYSKDELLGMNNRQLMDKENARKVFETFNRVYMTGKSSKAYNQKLITKAGAELFIETSISLRRDRLGKPVGFQGIAKDITESKQAEVELRKNYALLSIAERTAKFGGWSVDLTENRVVWSDEVAAIHEMPFGYSPPVNEGISFYAPEWQNTITKVFNDCAENGIPFDEEMEIITANRKRVWVRAIGEAVRDESGTIFRIQGAFQDITEQKKAEEKLQEQDRLLRLISDNMTDYLVVSGFDLRIQYISKSVSTNSGYTVEEMKELPFERQFTEESYIRLMKAVEENLTPEKLGDPECTISVEIDLEFLNKDGSTTWNSFIYSVIRDSEGQPKSILGVGRNITERKQTEEALKLSMECYRALFDNMSSGVAIYDVKDDGNDFVFKDYNKSGEIIDGNRKEDIIGKSVLDVRPGIKEFGLFDVFKRVWKTGKAEYHPLSLYKDSRLNKWYENYVYKLPSGEIVAVYDDLTESKLAEDEREKLQAQLNQAQKIESVGRLAGGVAHDFNNMLGVILGHAELALMLANPAEPLFNYLQEIKKAAERSADLTRQLLAFARKQTVTPKLLDLNETVEGMLKMLRRLIGEDIDLAWLNGENLWPVRIDPSQIDQIMANLCINARDAITDGGKVTIETENVSLDETYCTDHPGFTQGEYVMITVSDDGCGMDKETLANIFEPFFTTKSIGKGTGLGLSTVYGIVKQNRGFINVYSEPGQGTAFNIYLPRHRGKVEQHKKKDTADTDGYGHENILLVEDEPAILNMITRMLQSLGYTVQIASTPGEAIRLATEYAGEIHLLMTDVVMPEMNGRDLARNILSLYPNIRRIFMSGYTANVIAHQGVLDEGVPFIQKPFSMHDLVAKLREVLDSK